jgi:hypothetical protein
MTIFKIKFKKITLAKVFSGLSFLWLKVYKLLIVLYLLAAIGFGSYVWYQNLYSGQWSQDKKQKFIDSQEKTIILKEKDFRNTLSEIEKRKIEFEKEYQTEKDIFIPYEGYVDEKKN